MTVQGVKYQTNLGKPIEDILTSAVNVFTAMSGTGELAQIGKPSRFNSLVDQDNRISEYIRQRMNIIDLIPCDYTVNFAKKAGANTGSNESTLNNLENIKPTISYSESIDKYKSMCTNYNIPPYSGLRLYTTDETTATDEFRNTFTENIFGKAINTASQKFRSLRDLAKSASGKSMDAANQGINAASTAASGLAESMGASTSVASSISHFIENASDVIISGNTVSMPEIWDSSTYQPNASIVIKLVSPYGSPKAIKEFIIKPLTYLVLLTLPKTRDGISYGYPPTITTKAYGMADLTLSAIVGLTMRRGGNDTSFNIHKQPLSIDISLEISNLVKGCATFYEDIPASESNAFTKADQKIADSDIYENTTATLFQTPGKIIDSLRPSSLSTLNEENLGLTGNFSNMASVSERSLTGKLINKSTSSTVSREIYLREDGKLTGKLINKFTSSTVSRESYLREDGKLTGKLISATSIEQSSSHESQMFAKESSDNMISFVPSTEQAGTVFGSFLDTTLDVVEYGTDMISGVLGMVDDVISVGTDYVPGVLSSLQVSQILGVVTDIVSPTQMLNLSSILNNDFINDSAFSEMENIMGSVVSNAVLTPMMSEIQNLAGDFTSGIIADTGINLISSYLSGTVSNVANSEIVNVLSDAGNVTNETFSTVGRVAEIIQTPISAPQINVTMNFIKNQLNT